MCEIVQLEVKLFGPFAVIRNGQMLETKDWLRRKNRQLTKYLLMHRGQALSVDQLIEALHPDGDGLRNANNIRGRISEVRKILEPTLRDGSDSQYIVRLDQSTYMFSPAAPCLVDVDEFDRLVAEAKAAFLADDGRRAVSLMQRALVLYSTGLLPEDLYEEWAQAPRQRYLERYLETLFDLAKCHTHLGAHRDAAETYDRMIAEDPLYEAAHRGKMLALYHCGEGRHAVRAYDECAAVFAENGVKLEAETIALADSIRAAKLPRSVTPTGNNLRAWSTPFIGRERDIARITALLAEPRNRVLTLLGPGGIGKSRLAVEVARRELNHYKDGVHYVPIPPGASAAELLSAVAEGAGVQLHGQAPPTRQVASALKGKQKLLLIDNGENTADMHTLGELVAETSVTVLAASRERLRIPGECIVEVSALEVPLPESLIGRAKKDLTEWAASYDAPRLFIDRICRVDPQFVLSRESATDVQRICRLAAGMPLALELAASWGRTLTCREIANGIEESLNFLVAQSGEIAPDHLSIRAIFTHTWSRLSPEERRVYPRLSVFVDGYSPDAARQVAGASLSTVMALQDKALVYRTGSGRLFAHELLRRYAREQLDGDPAAQRQVHEAFAKYYTNRLAAHAARLEGPDQIATLELLREDSVNYDTLWRWLAQERRYDEIEQIVEGYTAFHRLNSRWQNLEGALRAARRQLEAHLQAQPADQERYRTLLGRLALHLGACHLHLGNLTESMGDYTEGREIARDLNDSLLTACCIAGMGMVYKSLGKLDEAEAHFRESLGLLPASGALRAQTLRHLGALQRLTRRLDEAELIFSECLDLYRSLGDHTEISGALLNLGTIHGTRHDIEAAERHFRESLDIARRVGHQMLIFMGTGNLGMLAYMRNDFGAALAYFTECLEVAEKIGHQEAQVMQSHHLVLAAAELGEFETAWGYLREGTLLAAELNIPSLIVRMVYAYGHLALCFGELAEAYAMITFALNHPAAQEPTKEFARADIDRLDKHLTAHVKATSALRLDHCSLDEIVGKIVTEDERPHPQETTEEVISRLKALSYSTFASAGSDPGKTNRNSWTTLKASKAPNP